MWPFKKKESLKEIEIPKFKTVICIPGSWESWDEFILAIVEKSNGEYIAAGNILIHAKQKKHFTIEFCEKDKNMIDSFKYAGMATGISEKTLFEIEKHKHIIYISCATGNLTDAGHIAFAAGAILKSGGQGVKIETSGKGFGKDAWISMLENFEEARVYHMFVVDSIMDENGQVFSCGMQNLGLKDTIIAGEEFQYSVDLVSLFGCYQVVDKPKIQSNQTFRADLESPVYRITEEHNPPYNGDTLYANPFGMWRLTRE